MGDLPRQNQPGKIKYFRGVNPNEVTDAFNALVEDINTIGVQVTDLNAGLNASSSTYWRGDGTWVQPGFSSLSGNIAVSQMASGTSASSSTFWRGDGAWAAPAFSNLAGNIAASQMNSGTGATSSTYWRGDGTWVQPGFSSLSGSITVAQMNSGTGATSSTYWRGDGTWVQPGFSSLSGSITVSQMNSGTGATSSTYWRGDGTWAAPPAGGIYHDGRLTLSAGVPVLTATVSGATTIYYAPQVGQMISVYDGTGVNPYNFLSGPTDTTGLTLALGSNWAATTLFDVFVTIQAAVPVLATVAWTNATTRATTLTRYGGILTNSASATARISNSSTITMAQNQGTYVGTFATNGSTGTVDFIFGAAASGGTAASFGVWNMYNRVRMSTIVVDNGTAYTYTSATMRAARASNTNRVTFISGVAEDSIQAVYSARWTSVSAAGSFVLQSIGLDSTTTSYAGSPLQQIGAAAVISNAASPAAYISPQLGQHFVQALEASDGTNANTFDAGTSNSLQVILSL